MTAIVLDRLAHSYHARPSAKPDDWALKETTFTFRHGGAYALLGPSGCGKTSMLNLMSGLVRPTRGRVLFGDRDVTGLATEARNIAQVFQFPVVYDTMTVGENLAFPLRNRGVDEASVGRRVHEIADLLDLSRHLQRKARGLTADAKQKISLGRGLVRPDVAAVLFDEPLTVIDPHLKWELRSKLKALHRQLDVTMIYVTHDQTEAMTFADEVVVMLDGTILQAGAPHELFDRPAHTFVGHFIGSPGMNLIRCTIERDRATAAGHLVRLAAVYGDMPADRTIQLGVRPDHVRLAPKGVGLPVQVRRIEDLGRTRIARVDFADTRLAVTAPDDVSPDGDEASIVIDPRRTNVYADSRLVLPAREDAVA